MHEVPNTVAVAEEMAATAVMLDRPARGRQVIHGPRQDGPEIGPGRQGLAVEDLSVHAADDQPVRMSSVGERIGRRASACHADDDTDQRRPRSIQ